MSYKLFIPGPIEVADRTYKAMTTPIMGHRSKEFVNLFAKMQPQLQDMFFTKDPVYISTSSSWGAMEGSLRNVVQKKVLNCMNGAFSDKWFDVANRCNVPAGNLRFDWGKPICPQELRKALSTNEYDAVTIIHNETSTGTMSDVKALADVLKEFPDVISILDTVSSFSVLPIKKDELGIDVIISGSQKALACPPGLCLLTVSQKALEKAKNTSGRGYYFDFVEFQNNYEKSMTPSTPVIPLMFALSDKLDEMFEETLEKRYARHEQNNNIVHAWVEKNGFELLPEKQFASKSLSCIKNTIEADMIGLNDELKKEYKMCFDTGYGKLKGKTFRISNMGNETPETMKELLNNIDTLLPKYLKK